MLKFFRNSKKQTEPMMVEEKNQWKKAPMSAWGY